MKVSIDKSKCIGCMACTFVDQIFEEDGVYAKAKDNASELLEGNTNLQDETRVAAQNCPVQAIDIEE